jgi:hypothetical protein
MRRVHLDDVVEGEERQRDPDRRRGGGLDFEQNSSIWVRMAGVTVKMAVKLVMLVGVVVDHPSWRSLGWP